MPRFIVVMAVLLLMNTGVSIAHGDTPSTFRGCVLAGGAILASNGELSCRHVHTEVVERIYGQMILENGETEFVEIWAETEIVAMTYPLAPWRTTIIERDSSTLFCEDASAHPDCVTD